MKKLTAILFIILAAVQAARAKDSMLPVRAGISDNTFKTYVFDNVSFNNASSLIIIDAQTGYKIHTEPSDNLLKAVFSDETFRLYIDGELKARNVSGPVLIYSKEGCTEITGLKRKGKQACYRGYIELVQSSKMPSKFSIVNVLSLSDYLKGVVPNEMPVKFGLEALKAQAAAARNYAVAPRVKLYDEFNLCDSVECQVYFGANTESDLSNQAVDETDGIIAVDRNKKPILALYSSTAGGYTESYSMTFSDPLTKAFPSEEIEHLSAVPDSPDFGTLETDEKAELFYMSAPEAFDDMSPYYRWDKEWTRQELETVLNKTMPAQSKTGFITPAVNEGETIGRLISIRALERGVSGKIVKLEIKTDKNTYIVSKELVIRRCFQKNGISLPSANFVISYINAKTPVYKFNGGGFGHGCGMSQWGAGRMGQLGYKYDEILKHYYKGIELVQYEDIMKPKPFFEASDEEKEAE